MWINVDKSQSLYPRQQYVYKPVLKLDLSTTYTHEAEAQKRVSRQGLKKKVDRLSPYTHCLLLRLL